MKSRTLLWLTLFTVSMALVEATLVVYLRYLYYPNNPLTIFPLHLMLHRDLGMELARELATLVIILCVALLAVRDRGQRFAAFVYVFGMWDLLYYLWLKILIGWPQSWLEWDILFLIPWPWMGPWIAPAIIALFFTGWGGVVLYKLHKVHFNMASGGLFILGAIFGLFTFLWPGALLLPGGEVAFDGYVPESFLWPVYIIGLAAMTAGLILSLRKR